MTPKRLRIAVLGCLFFSGLLFFIVCLAQSMCIAFFFLYIKKLRQVPALRNLQSKILHRKTAKEGERGGSQEEGQRGATIFLPFSNMLRLFPGPPRPHRKSGFSAAGFERGEEPSHMYCGKSFQRLEVAMDKGQSL